MATKFDIEIACREDRLHLHMHFDILRLRILLHTEFAVTLDEFSRTFVVAEKIMEGTLQLAFDLWVPIGESLVVEEILKHRGDRYPDSPTLLAQNGYSIEETARQVRNLYFLAR